MISSKNLSTINCRLSLPKLQNYRSFDIAAMTILRHKSDKVVESACKLCNLLLVVDLPKVMIKGL